MADDTFRLTPLDVRRYEFGRAMRGYDRALVDQFKEQVAGELERLTRVTQELEQKARNFHEQLRAFRDRDRAMSEALIAAQQLRSETREAAEREAELVKREAQSEAERVVREARAEAQRTIDAARVEAMRHTEERRGELRRLEEEAESLDRVHRTYLAQLRLLAERQLAELSVAEQRTLPPVRARAALPDRTSEPDAAHVEAGA
ncbi:MAG TPA: DivIVA domain-containing protein [Gemmatirosa sp.]